MSLESIEGRFCNHSVNGFLHPFLELLSLAVQDGVQDPGRRHVQYGANVHDNVIDGTSLSVLSLVAASLLKVVLYSLAWAVTPFFLILQEIQYNTDCFCGIFDVWNSDIAE